MVSLSSLSGTLMDSVETKGILTQAGQPEECTLKDGGKDKHGSQPAFQAGTVWSGGP